MQLLLFVVLFAAQIGRIMRDTTRIVTPPSWE